MLVHAYDIIIDCDVGAPGHIREVADSFNANEKRFISMLTKKAQLPSAMEYDTHMEMNTSTVNTDISLAREFQKYLFDPSSKKCVMDQGKYIKRLSQRTCTECEYHYQDRKDESHTSARMSFSTTQLPELDFCGLHMKPHGLRGLSKHDHILLDPKLGRKMFNKTDTLCICGM